MSQRAVRLRCLAAITAGASLFACQKTRESETWTTTYAPGEYNSGPFGEDPNRPSGCGTSAFCELAGKAPPPGPRAKEPYAMCGETSVHPDDRKKVDNRGHTVRFHPPITEKERTKRPDACCYVATSPCGLGRALRDPDGAIALAPVVARSDWSVEAIERLARGDAATRTAAERAKLADEWRRDAAAEHASIAAFAQLALDLLALGAPPALLLRTQDALADEIRHAQAAFACASAYGGMRVGPASLAAPMRAPLTLAELARSTFVDGCIGETLGAAALAARAATTPRLHDVLVEMAADEERHADLAWSIVGWACARGGDEVTRAVADAHASTPRTDDAQWREVIDPCVASLEGQRCA